MDNKDRNISMIKDLVNAHAPSGFEDEVLEVVREQVAGLGDFEEDHIRTLYIARKGNSGKPLMMLDAHADEVGFMVHSVRPNGTIRFTNIGGWNPGTLPSSRVLVRNAEGKYIPGIIAAKPIHFMSQADRDRKPEISDLSIDIGSTSKEETEKVYKIRIGEPIVPDTPFTYDEEHDIMMGKAFDDRVGVAALIETMRRLEGEDLKVDVMGVVSAQEEVGSRGAKVAVSKVNPDISICFEACPSDDTFTEPYAIQAAIKKGPMLRFMDRTVICNPRFQRYALDLAEKLGIPVQASVREGGGNNGAMICVSEKGTPVIVVAIPVRYIHSHNCIATYHDFNAAVELAVAIVKDLDEEKVAGF